MNESTGNFRDDLLLQCTEWDNDLDMGHLRTGEARGHEESTTSRTVCLVPQRTGNAGHRVMVHRAMDKQGYWGTSGNASDSYIEKL